MTSEEGNENRRHIIRGLEQRYQHAKAKALQTETESAQAKRELEAMEAARLRTQLPFPAGDVCPECWLIHGNITELYPVPHDDPEHYDRMRCKAPCGYFEDRST
jgi:hypothetical protein